MFLYPTVGEKNMQLGALLAPMLLPQHALNHLLLKQMFLMMKDDAGLELLGVG